MDGELSTIGIREYTTGAPAPRFNEIVHTNPDDRNEELKRRVWSTTEPEQQFTEKEGLLQLDAFLDEVQSVAERTENTELTEEVTAFRDNLVFVGEIEMHTAVDGIAQRILERMQKGHEIYIYFANTRSEQYIAILLAERLEALLRPINRDALGEIHLSRDDLAIAQHIRRSKEFSSIFVVDDFSLSGVRIKGDVGTMQASLLKEGFTQAQALAMIEADLIASDENMTYEVPDVTQQGQYVPFPVFSYYGVPEYKNSQGQWFFHPGVSITGAHCATDYGFENVIKGFNEALKKAGSSEVTVLLTDLYKPYGAINRQGTEFDRRYKSRVTRMEQLFPLP